jgi:predicted site-specific integrase-resolvase
MPNLSEQTTAERFLRPKQVQAILGVAATTLWNYAHRGLLKPSHHTVGGHARYRETDVAAFKARLSGSPKPHAEVAA